MTTELSIDMRKYRDTIRRVFQNVKKDLDQPARFKPDQGVQMVETDDIYLLDESLHEPGTIRNWAGTSYQKREDGSWKKLGSSKKMKLKPKKKEKP